MLCILYTYMFVLNIMAENTQRVPRAKIQFKQNPYLITSYSLEIAFYTNSTRDLCCVVNIRCTDFVCVFFKQDIFNMLIKKLSYNCSSQISAVSIIK